MEIILLNKIKTPVGASSEHLMRVIQSLIHIC